MVKFQPNYSKCEYFISLFWEKEVWIKQKNLFGCLHWCSVLLCCTGEWGDSRTRLLRGKQSSTSAPYWNSAHTIAVWHHLGLQHRPWRSSSVTGWRVFLLCPDLRQLFPMLLLFFFMINIDILFSLAKTLVGNPPPLCFPLTLSVEKLLSHFDHWLSLPDHRGRETHTPVSDNILCCVCCLFLYILIILKKQ